MWDTIVLGSGIAGLTAAAALARRGQRVLVLEQHGVAGGQTQTFSRDGWTFATGVHAVSGADSRAASAGHFARLMDRLTDGNLTFADCGNPYDIIRLPGFEFGIEHPEAAYRAALNARFPRMQGEIAVWFAEMEDARKSAMALFALHGMPHWMAWGLRLWRGADIRRFAERTLEQALRGIDDAHLQAMLGARWGRYGTPPGTAPLIEHALVTGAYNDGASYPVGGPGQFLQTLQPVIEASGGEIRTGATVTGIDLVDGQVCGVTVAQAGTRKSEGSRRVISAIGAHNTVDCLDPRVAPEWQAQIRQLQAGLTYLCLYIGLDGDIEAGGATSADVWIYESTDIGKVWHSPASEDAPALFVAFASMKDRGHTLKPTATVLALCDASSFAPWLRAPGRTDAREKGADYYQLKATIESRLLAQFRRHFPDLSPMIRYQELATPLTQWHDGRTLEGSMYGVEMTARRLNSDALDVRTPIGGLVMAGQDVVGAGVQASSLSGLMAAAVFEPFLLKELMG